MEIVKALPDIQNGIRKGRGTIDNIFMPNDIIQKTIEKKEKLCCTFLDLRAAFDIIDRARIINTLRKIKNRIE